jgi:dTDP-4-amino-4,6-dideoxygalactose transaminase
VAAGNREVGAGLDRAIARVIASGRFILGPELEAFESEWAHYAGAKGCVGVGNGLDALTLALRAMDVGPGDDVAVPGQTFVATWLAVTATGARPVPVDVDPDTANMDPALLEAAITPRMKAVVPVHLFGRLAPMAEIAAIARRHGLRVLEDAAQAHGARDENGKAGTLADAAAWSFYPGKNLGALGDAGAVTSHDPNLLARVRILRNYGSPVRYQHEVLGVNSRLDEMQAAVLRTKLPLLNAWNTRRAHVAATYLRELAALGERLTLPKPAGHEHSWHLFVVRSANRDGLRDALAAAGIDTLIHYPKPPHLQPAYAHLGIKAGSLPVSEDFAARSLSLPIGPHMSADQVERVIEAVRKAVAE